MSGWPHFARSFIVGVGANILTDSLWRSILGALAFLAAFWLTDEMHRRSACGTPEPTNG